MFNSRLKSVHPYSPHHHVLTILQTISMMTLLTGHGSNVMGIETTATYDAASREFIINTPDNEASKYWIGGTGQHGKVLKRVQG